MNTLYFKSYGRREQSLEGPLFGTFNWIFERSGQMIPTQPVYWDKIRLKWPSFPLWLENSESDQQYCFMGSKGSGTSTLMALVARDRKKQTSEHLSRWANQRPVHIIRHFFSGSGSDRLDRTFEGLLRSLLIQVLNAVPGSQQQLVSQYMAGPNRDRLVDFSVEELKRMLMFAIRNATDTAFCIFVDGIHEIEKSADCPSGPDDLVEFLMALQVPPHVKLCVSSRPEVRSLGRIESMSNTTLDLAQLNHQDIWRFVMERLHGRTDNPGISPEDIINNANGQFWWAATAVDETIERAEFWAAAFPTTDRTTGAG